MLRSLLQGKEWAPLRTKIIRCGLSLVFIGIAFFELLNYLNVLHFSVDYTWFGRLFSTLFIFTTLLLIDLIVWRTLQIRLDGKIWLFLAILLTFDFLGDIFHFYTRWEWYDQLVHFMSGLVLVTVLGLCFEQIVTRKGWNIPLPMLYLLVLGVNTIFAVLYEIEEYSEDYLYHTHRLGDGPDTVNDLLLNLVAGVLTVVCILSYRSLTRSKQSSLV